jgi:predicted nuclease of predicted toxin-antitoxin system
MAAVKLYFDEMVAREPARKLNERGYDVVLAVDEGMMQKKDHQHLAYATEHERVLVTFDRPFAGRTMKQSNHAGLICLTSVQQDDIGGIIRLLHTFVETHNAEDCVGFVFWL